MVGSSKTSFNIADLVMHGLGEIQPKSRDAYAFYSTIFALLTTLKMNNIWHLVERDKSMIEVVRSLSRLLYLIADRKSVV